MSMDLKADILNAIMESKFIKNKCKTPKFRKPTPAPKPNPNYIPPSSVAKTSPPNVGSSVQSPKKPCTYSTPCGWCTKWEKKCDKRIGGGNDAEPRKKKDAALEYIKSGKGMPDNDMEWFL